MKNKVEYISNSRIITLNETRYMQKIKKSNKEDLFDYLNTKGFKNFLPYEMEKDNYELYRYIEEKIIPKEDKAIELMNILSSLHNATTTYQKVNINDVKELFETTKEKITYLRNYYLDLQDYIETKEFFSPAEQVLMNNISNVYKALNYSEYKLTKWYELKEKQTMERIVQLHNNLSLEHFLKEENSYLINWDKSKKDYVIYDFINFYKNEFQNLEMYSLFSLYQKNYQYTEDERLLFESLLSLPDKITFTKTNYINTIDARRIINYIEMTNIFLSEDNKKDQESNQ